MIKTILTSKQVIILYIASLIVMMLSGLGVVYSAYENRRLYNLLQDEQEKLSMLQAERSKLLIEYSLLTSPEQIETQAIEKIEMIVPHDDSIGAVVK